MPFQREAEQQPQQEARSEERGRRREVKSMNEKEEGRTSFLTSSISQRLEASALKFPIAA